MTVWVVRVVDGDEKEREALRRGVCITGWGDIPDFRTLPTNRDLKEAIGRKYPAKNNAGLSGWAGQIQRFRDEMTKGDFVVMPSKFSPVLHVGMVQGDYEFVAAKEGSSRHQRPVEWIGVLPKATIVSEAAGSLGAFLTIFRVDKPKFEKQLKEIADGRRIAEKPTSGAQPA
jgi:restriction system protein